MFKFCRILNKKTGENYIGQLDTEYEHLLKYDMIEIPNDDKEYEYISIPPYYQEKAVEIPDIEMLRQFGLAYYNQKALEYRQIPFLVELNTTEGLITVQADLTEVNISDWILVYLKKGDIKLVKVNKVINENTIEEDCVVRITVVEAERIREVLTTRIDNLTILDAKISKKIKTVSDELVVKVFMMNKVQLEQFAGSIMSNVESILLMGDDQFTDYINNLVNQITNN